MIDFGRFVYMDVQKTGSTYVEKFLLRNSALPLKRHRKHGRRGAGFSLVFADFVWPRPFFFISTRNPVDQWRSLYFYGCDGKGAVWGRVQKHSEVSRLYDGTENGLNAWLDYMLSEGAHRVLREDYTPAAEELYGFQTHRFLQLSFRSPARRTRRFRDRDDVLRAFQKHRLHSYILHNETLNDDLEALVRGPLGQYLRNPAAAIDELRQSARVNSSTNSTSRSIAIDPDLRERIRQREWFFFEQLGY